MFPGIGTKRQKDIGIDSDHGGKKWLSVILPLQSVKRRNKEEVSQRKERKRQEEREREIMRQKDKGTEMNINEYER